MVINTRYGFLHTYMSIILESDIIFFFVNLSNDMWLAATPKRELAPPRKGK